jgi:Type I phosphodiesterase / nucleotide pyrophosphatase
VRCPSAYLFLLAAFLPTHAAAQVERVVVVKADGLSPALIEQYLNRPEDPRTPVPWMAYIFAQHGVWFENFYSRGLSLSAPSWSILDTGRHLEIRGNVEYDRYTLNAFDYLNVFPAYFARGTAHQMDMAGVELLDEHHIPLLIDRFPYGAWYQNAQLLQRSVNWDSMQGALKRTFSAKSVRDVVDEWQVGWQFAASWSRENEERLVADLNNPKIQYLEFFSGGFDHVAHLTNDRVSQMHEVQLVDELVGRLWTAIRKSSLADSTGLVLVSDHGMTTGPDIISQGYNLVDWFTRRAGGAQNVLTNRHPLEEFKIKGMNIFVDKVVTPASESSYLAGTGDQYPTVMLDLDGNERASVGLRSNAFNRLHLLLDQLLRKGVTGPVRAAAVAAFFEALAVVRTDWRRDLAELKAATTDLGDRIDAQQRLLAALPKKWTPDQIAAGLQDDGDRQRRRLNVMRDDVALYTKYAATLTRLLDLTPAALDAGKLKVADLIPTSSLGPANSLWDIRHYVTDVGPDGLVLTPEGRLDWARSVRTTDYLPALAAISVRNNVQDGVGPRPIDFTALRVPDSDNREAIWLYRDEEHQALIRFKEGMLRYQPIARLEARQDGAVVFQERDWAAGFPLEIFEDPNFAVPAADRATWLAQWHSEEDWLRVVHRTRYSNGVIGLTEELLTGSPAATPYLALRRRLRRTDLLVLAYDHWNFNARGFNPGGNHGSFFRTSTHAVLLVAGGKDTGIPQRLRVETPYDGLSFAPTILKLMGRPEPDLPGALIKELLPTDPSTRRP